jgi:hypothetical protein
VCVRYCGVSCSLKLDDVIIASDDVHDCVSFVAANEQYGTIAVRSLADLHLFVKTYNGTSWRLTEGKIPRPLSARRAAPRAPQVWLHLLQSDAPPMAPMAEILCMLARRDDVASLPLVDVSAAAWAKDVFPRLKARCVGTAGGSFAGVAIGSTAAGALKIVHTPLELAAFVALFASCRRRVFVFDARPLMYVTALCHPLRVSCR